MAEKVELIELTISVDKATQDSRALRISMQQLKEETERLKEEQGELSDEYIEAQATYKAVQAELRQQEKLTQNIIAAQNAEVGSLDQLKKQLAVVSVQWSKLSEEERLNTDRGKQLTAQKLKLTEQLKREERATGDATRNVGNYNESIGQSIGLMGQFVPAVGKAATGAQALGRAFTVALGPIGLVVAAIAAVVTGLKAFFTASEEGEDAWDKFAGAAEIALGNIQDRLSDLTKSIIEDPKGAFNDFLDFFKNSFGKQLQGAWDFLVGTFQAGFATINLGYQKLKGQFTDNTQGILDAQKSIEEANKAITDSFKTMAEGAINAVQPVVDFYQETNKEIEENNKLLDRQANLNRFIRNARISNAKAELEVSKLRNQVAQTENFTSQERLKFLDEAIKLEGEILNRNERIAQAEKSIAFARAEFSKNDREAKDKLADAEVKLFQVQKANFDKTKELEGQRATLLREIANQKKQEALDEVANLELLVSEENKLNQQRAKQDLEIQKNLDAAKQELKQNEAARRQIEFEAEYALAQENVFRRLELERESLEQQAAQEIEFAEKIGADTTLIEQKYAKAREAITEAEQEAKLSLAAGFAANLATIAGEGTAIAKAAGVAETTINTYKAAQGAYSALAGIPVVGPALGVVAAAAAVAAGIANVKKILSVKSGLPGGDKGGSASISASSASAAPTKLTTSAPTVNQGIVSRDTLQGANQQEITVQPTLVEDDVTSKQRSQNSNNQTSVI
jgi:hypothetical protein